MVCHWWSTSGFIAAHSHWWTTGVILSGYKTQTVYFWHCVIKRRYPMNHVIKSFLCLFVIENKETFHFILPTIQQPPVFFNLRCLQDKRDCICICHTASYNSKNTQKNVYCPIPPYGHRKSEQHKLTKFANMTQNINICPCTINVNPIIASFQNFLFEIVSEIRLFWVMFI